MSKISYIIISNALDVMKMVRTVRVGKAFNHAPNASLFFVRTAM